MSTSTTLTIDAKFQSYYKAPGAARARLVLITNDEQKQNVTPLSIDVDDSTYGSVFSGLTPGAGITLGVTIN